MYVKWDFDAVIIKSDLHSPWLKENITLFCCKVSIKGPYGFLSKYLTVKFYIPNFYTVELFYLCCIEIFRGNYVYSNVTD